MRRAVVAFVRGLPLDRRSRRVLDETLLDCEHEAVGATTVLMRFAVELRSLLSIARVLVFGVGIRPLRPFTLVCAASEIVLSLAVVWLSAHLTQRTSARA